MLLLDVLKLKSTKTQIHFVLFQRHSLSLSQISCGFFSSFEGRLFTWDECCAINDRHQLFDLHHLLVVSTVVVAAVITCTRSKMTRDNSPADHSSQLHSMVAVFSFWSFEPDKHEYSVQNCIACGVNWLIWWF